MVNVHPWFITDWLDSLQEHCTPSIWSKAKNYVRDGKVKGLSKLGQLVGTVNSGQTFQFTAQASLLSAQDKANIIAVYQRKPKLLLLVYQQRLTHEDVQAYLYSLGFTQPLLDYVCSCGSTEQPCAHVLAGILQFIEELPAAYIPFLKLQGVDWEQILDVNTGSGTDSVHAPDTPKVRSIAEEEYGLVPLPAPPPVESSKKVLEAPPFWTSSFSYPLMMQEIYTKVKEDRRLTPKKGD